MSAKNYVEEEDEKKELSFKENKTLFIKTKLKKAGLAIWNNKEKEFFGRDSLSWSKFMEKLFKNWKFILNNLPSICWVNVFYLLWSFGRI